MASRRQDQVAGRQRVHPRIHVRAPRRTVGAGELGGRIAARRLARRSTRPCRAGRTGPRPGPSGSVPCSSRCSRSALVVDLRRLAGGQNDRRAHRPRTRSTVRRCSRNAEPVGHPSAIWAPEPRFAARMNSTTVADGASPDHGGRAARRAAPPSQLLERRRHQIERRPRIAVRAATSVTGRTRRPDARAASRTSPAPCPRPGRSRPGRTTAPAPRPGSDAAARLAEDTQAACLAHPPHLPTQHATSTTPKCRLFDAARVAPPSNTIWTTRSAIRLLRVLLQECGVQPCTVRR